MFDRCIEIDDCPGVTGEGLVHMLYYDVEIGHGGIWFRGLFGGLGQRLQNIPDTFEWNFVKAASVIQLP